MWTVNLGVGGFWEPLSEDRHHRGKHKQSSQGSHEPGHWQSQKTRVIFIAPVVEVVNVDHEGEVGEGSQHESGDEAGRDVVAGLPHKVHHHLETLL